jgi:hypothetical protein
VQLSGTENGTYSKNDISKRKSAADRIIASAGSDGVGHAG